MAKDPRLNVTIPQSLFNMTLQDALATRRSHANQVVHILEMYYEARKKEAELFTPTELGEGKRRRAPVFENKDQLALEQPLERHDSRGREKS